jgi:hypothetical protein
MAIWPYYLTEENAVDFKTSALLQNYDSIISGVNNIKLILYLIFKLALNVIDEILRLLSQIRFQF